MEYRISVRIRPDLEPTLIRVALDERRKTRDYCSLVAERHLEEHLEAERKRLAAETEQVA